VSADAIARVERIIAWILGGILALNLLLVLFYVLAFISRKFCEWWAALWSGR